MEAVNGSNESSEHPVEESDPHLRKYSPWLKNFTMSRVCSTYDLEFWFLLTASHSDEMFDAMQLEETFSSGIPVQSDVR